MADLKAAWYGRGIEASQQGEIDWLTDDFRVMLLDESYSFSKDHDFLSDVVGSQLAAVDGYTLGGKAFANKDVVYSGTANRMSLLADNVEWSGATFSPRWGVIYNNTPATNAEKHLLGYLDFSRPLYAMGMFRLAWTNRIVLSMSVV